MTAAGNLCTFLSYSTCSAKRVLRRISGREKRCIQNLVHVLVNNLIEQPFTTYVIEDLTGIKQRMKKTKSKEWNHKFSTWIYGLFDTVLEYKAQPVGKTVIKIDPAYTSQTCFLCDRVDRSNRKKEKFVCRACGYTTHADFNASSGDCC